MIDNSTILMKTIVSLFLYVCVYVCACEYVCAYLCECVLVWLSRHVLASSWLSKAVLERHASHVLRLLLLRVRWCVFACAHVCFRLSVCLLYVSCRLCSKLSSVADSNMFLSWLSKTGLESHGCKVILTFVLLCEIGLFAYVCFLSPLRQAK